MFPWQLLFVSLLANVRGQSLKTPLYVGSMAPLTGSRAWWGAGITAAMQMAFEYINNRSDILPFYELRLLAHDTQVRFLRPYHLLEYCKWSWGFEIRLNDPKRI